jgi:hypothetical protein
LTKSVPEKFLHRFASKRDAFSFFLLAKIDTRFLGFILHFFKDARKKNAKLSAAVKMEFYLYEGDLEYDSTMSGIWTIIDRGVASIPAGETIAMEDDVVVVSLGRVTVQNDDRSHAYFQDRKSVFPISVRIYQLREKVSVKYLIENFKKLSFEEVKHLVKSTASTSSQ